MWWNTPCIVSLALYVSSCIMRSSCVVCSSSLSTVAAQQGSSMLCSAWRSHYVHVLNLTTSTACAHTAGTHHHPVTGHNLHVPNTTLSSATLLSVTPLPLTSPGPAPLLTPPHPFLSQFNILIFIYSYGSSYSNLTDGKFSVLI